MARPSHLYSTLAALTVATLVSSAPRSPKPHRHRPRPHAAAAEPAKPEPDWTFTGNVGLYSQYVFRGLTQTNESPRCRAASTSATRAASTSAPGHRT